MFRKKKENIKSTEELFNMLLNEILDEKSKKKWEQLKEI